MSGRSSAVERPAKRGGHLSINYVYILHSLKDKKYYIGSTKHLERRLKEHNTGKTKSIKYRIPFKLIYFEEFESSKLAIKRELQIKKFKGGNSFKKLIGI